MIKQIPIIDEMGRRLTPDEFPGHWVWYQRPPKPLKSGRVPAKCTRSLIGRSYEQILDSAWQYFRIVTPLPKEFMPVDWCVYLEFADKPSTDVTCHLFTPQEFTELGYKGWWSRDYDSNS